MDMLPLIANIKSLISKDLGYQLVVISDSKQHSSHNTYKVIWLYFLFRFRV